MPFEQPRRRGGAEEKRREPGRPEVMPPHERLKRKDLRRRRPLLPWPRPPGLEVTPTLNDLILRLNSLIKDFERLRK